MQIGESSSWVCSACSPAVAAACPSALVCVLLVLRREKEYEDKNEINNDIKMIIVKCISAFLSNILHLFITYKHREWCVYLQDGLRDLYTSQC